MYLKLKKSHFNLKSSHFNLKNRLFNLKQFSLKLKEKNSASVCDMGRQPTHYGSNHGKSGQMEKIKLIVEQPSTPILHNWYRFYQFCTYAIITYTQICTDECFPNFALILKKKNTLFFFIKMLTYLTEETKIDRTLLIKVKENFIYKVT